MKLEIDLPETLAEIRLSQYQEFLLIEEPSPEDVVRVFSSTEKSIVDKISKIDIEKASDCILGLFEKKQGLINRFDYNGMKWGFIPNIDNITWGENRDANKYLSDWQEIHKAMAVLYRPIKSEKKGKYIIEDYENTNKYSEVMKDMPLNVAMGAMVFFYSLLNELLRATPNYILSNLTIQQKNQLVSLQSGTTTTKSLRSVREILEGLTKLPDLGFTHAYTT